MVLVGKPYEPPWGFASTFWAASAVVLSALPTGALVFTVAQYYGFWVAGASASVLISTILSLLTVSAAIVLTGLR